MTRRTFTIKRATRYAELLRAKYLAREQIKNHLIVRPDMLDATDKHEALAAYDDAVQRGVEEERAEERAEDDWNDENNSGMP